jgi:hypothetical protein
LIGIAVLVLLLIARIGIGLSSRGSDKHQIQEALQRSIQASKDGRPGGVLQLLSDRLTFNGQDAKGNMSDVAQFIVKQRPDVEVENSEPVVTGDEARILSPIDIKLDFFGQTKSVHLKQVELVFRKEPVMRYLVFPGSEWKLSDVRAPNVRDSDFIQ